MGYYDNDVYCQPETHGLTIVAQASDQDASYSFDYAVLWKHEDGRFFYAEDSGCSCPSPFEDCNSVDDLTLVDDWQHLKVLLSEWLPAYQTPEPDWVQAERHDVLVAAHEAGLA